MKNRLLSLEVKTTPEELRKLAQKRTFPSPAFILFNDGPEMLSKSVCDTPTGRMIIAFTAKMIDQMLSWEGWTLDLEMHYASRFLEELNRIQRDDLRRLCEGETEFHDRDLLPMIKKIGINPVFIYDKLLSPHAKFFMS
jgi:hypothetical protein